MLLQKQQQASPKKEAFTQQLRIDFSHKFKSIIFAVKNSNMILIPNKKQLSPIDAHKRQKNVLECFCRKWGEGYQFYGQWISNCCQQKEQYLNYIRKMKVFRKGVLAVILMLSLFGVIHSFEFDVSQKNKYGNQTIFDTPCNIQTEIDFFFSGNTKLTCDGSTCTPTKESESTMKFFDINGATLNLKLQSAEYTNYKLEKTQQGGSATKYFVFTFISEDNTNRVYVVVPVTSGYDGTISRVIDLAKIEDESFTTLKSLTDMKNGLTLSVFNILNMMDYSRFYHVTNKEQTHTVLMSVATFETASEIKGWLTTSSLSVTPDYAASGNKLCYASQETQSIFQTHLRESWPLWTAWFAIFFYWLYYLIAPSDTKQCFDKSFENNRLTCWPVYSVHYIGHEQFFTRLSRITLMLINFTIQGVILAAMFLTLGPSEQPIMILWAGCVAAGCTHFVPYFFGCVFLSKIHKSTLDKFKVFKKAKSTAVKEQAQDDLYEEEIDKIQQRLFTLYYWYYIIAFAIFVSLWTVSVHLMTLLPRQYYTEHHYWIASLACAFVIENFILEPFFAFLLGRKSFYQKRGFFYNYELGEEYKEIEQ